MSLTERAPADQPDSAESRKVNVLLYLSLIF